MKNVFADQLTCALNLTLVEGEVGEGSDTTLAWSAILPRAGPGCLHLYVCVYLSSTPRIVLKSVHSRTPPLPAPLISTNHSLRTQNEVMNQSSRRSQTLHDCIPALKCQEAVSV